MTDRAGPGIAAGVQPLTAASRGLADRPLTGILCAALGVSGFALMDAAVKHLGETYPIGQIIVLRNLIALLPLSILLWQSGGLAALRSRQPVLQLLRGFAIFGAMMSFFHGLRFLGLAEATALGFAAPLLITALSVPLLRESVGRHRWSAVLLGFAGILVMLRPGGESVQLAAFLPLAAAFCYALAMIATRRLSRTDTTAGIAIYGNLTALALSLSTLPFGWTTPSGEDLWIIAFMGLMGGFSSIFLSLAYRFAPAAVVAPFDYVSLIWAVVIGWLVWRELPDQMTWLGAAIVIASGLYILRREAKRSTVA